MKILHFLFLLFNIPNIRCEYHLNSSGVVLKYSVNFQNKCRSQTGRFVFLNGFSISQCVEECALRPRCLSLNYRRLSKVCELFSVAEEGDTHIKSCVFMKATDINVLQTPCGLCNDNEMCDVNIQTCVIKECQPLSDPKNGKLVGNKHEIGAKVKFRCNGFIPNIAEAVCLSNGQWSATADCTKECGDVPSITHGLIVRESTNLGQATVTCDNGYQADVVTINCTLNGNWENASCNPISCGVPPAVASGSIDSYTGTFYMDTASVSCNANYKANVNTISCLASGIWQTVSCTPNDCYVSTVWDYAGTRNVTPSGYPCDFWTNHIGDFRVNVEWMPETTVAEAKNYCRQPTDNNWSLFCFSTHPSHEWELCGISKC